MVEYVVKTEGEKTESKAGARLEGLIAETNKKLSNAKVDELGEPSLITYIANIRPKEDEVVGNDFLSPISNNKGWDMIDSFMKKNEGFEVVNYEIRSVYDISKVQFDAIYGRKPTTSFGAEIQKKSHSTQIFK